MSMLQEKEERIGAEVSNSYWFDGALFNLHTSNSWLSVDTFRLNPFKTYITPFIIYLGKNENEEKRELVFKEDGQGRSAVCYSIGFTTPGLGIIGLT